jgi:hypothetical protein
MVSAEGHERDGRRQVPPYASFVAFESFLRRAAAESVQLQIDKTVLVGWGIAAGNESGLLTTVKALGILDAEGRPTELYRELRLSQPRRVTALRRAAELAYPGLSAVGQSIDENQLYDYFVERRGLTGQMVDKAIRFYRQLVDALARDLAPLESEPTRQPNSPRGGSGRPGPVPLPITRPRPGASTLHPAPVLLGDSAASAQIADAPLTFVLQIAPSSTEDELTEFFRRVRRAWRRSYVDSDE